MAQTVAEMAAQLRAQAQQLLQAAELLDKSSVGEVQLSDATGKIGRFSKEGMERLKKFNAEKWIECPKSPQCQTRDKATGRMRPKKHRLGHPHLKGATVTHLPTKTAASKSA